MAIFTAATWGLAMAAPMLPSTDATSSRFASFAISSARSSESFVSRARVRVTARECLGLP